MKRYSDSVADNTLLVSQNVTNLMDDIRAEDLLNDAVYYIDARDASASGQTIDNLGTAKELLPTTLGSSTSADSNDPQYLSWSGTNYVYLPGVASNYLSTPDAAALDITGDIDLRVRIAADDYTLAGNQSLIGKYSGTGNNLSYWFRMNSGALYLSWSANGSTGISKVSTATVSAAAGSEIWLRATLDVDNGADGNDVMFYTSTNGTTWTQLGATVTTAGTTSIYNSSIPLEIGSVDNGVNRFTMKLYRAQVLNGIDGTKVLDVDTSVLKTGAETSFTALTGQTVTINRSTSGRKTVAVTQPCWLFGTDDYMEVNNRYMSSGTYLYLPGVSGNYVSSPDSAALDITGDIDIRAYVAADDWTPAANMALVARYNTTGNLRAYLLQLNTAGTLTFNTSPDGTAVVTATSTIATGVADGASKWVRVTRDVDNGASGNDTKFYTSDDGTTWTQLGTTVTVAGTTSIFDNSRIVEIGSSATGASDRFAGKIFRAQIFNGIDGTKVFDADFENKITSLEQASFTEASSNAATVTINRSGSTYRSAGITTAGYLYPGATNTFAASATDFLNFEASDSFTLLAISRYWNATATNRVLIGKVVSSGGVAWSLRKTNNELTTFTNVSDGTNAGVSTASALTAGTLESGAGVINRSTQTVQTYVNTNAASTASTSAVGSLSNLNNFRIGAYANGAFFTDMEFLAAAVFRRALTSSEITLITNYFNRRSL